MRKKLFALMLAGTMVLGGSYPVLAEETEANEINWEDVAPAVEEAGWEGDFVTFDEIAVQIFVPDVLLPTELTDEDREQGYIGYYMTEDETAAVSVMYVDMESTTMEEYQAYLEEEPDVDEIETGVINGIPVITYTMPESDTACVSITTEAGYVLEFAFSPVSDEGFEAVAQIMMASIQEEVTEEAAETAE